MFLQYSRKLSFTKIITENLIRMDVTHLNAKLCKNGSFSTIQGKNQRGGRAGLIRKCLVLPECQCQTLGIKLGGVCVRRGFEMGVVVVGGYLRDRGTDGVFLHGLYILTPPTHTNNLPYSKRQSVGDGHQTKNFTQNLF